MKNKVIATIEKYHMIEQGDEITVGLSGGADSVALLYLLYLVREEWDITLKAAHLNHCLRGAESQRDEEFSRYFATQLEIPFYSEKRLVANIAEIKGRSIEEAAREERYSFFEKVATTGKIATAHSRSDSVETTLLNMVRGTGITGLTGIPPVRGRIIRPLIECTREEIETFCRIHRLQYVMDSSNMKTIYSRNKIRHQVTPVLKDMNEKFEINVSRMQQLLQEDADYLNNMAMDAFYKIYEPERLERESFLQLPKAIQTRVLGILLSQKRVECSQDRIQMMLEEIKYQRSGLQLSTQWVLIVKKDHFFLREYDKNPVKEKFSLVETLTWPINKVLSLPWGKTVRVRSVEYDEIENILEKTPNDLKYLVDYDKIDTIVIFRQRFEGDRFRPAFRGCTKTLRKLMNENKIPLEQRDELLVLEDKSGILWVELFGADETVVATRETKRALEFINE